MKTKIFLGVGIGIVLVLVAIMIVTSFFLGNVVKVGMESVGPKVTQTAFNVDAVSISLMTGSVGLNNFVLGNPDEYKAKAPNAITVAKVAVSVAPLSVMSDKIIVKNIEVREPEITFVGNPFGANNLKQIMDNVNAFTGGAESKPAGTNAPPKPPEKPAGKKLQVDKFLITGAKVHFNGATLPLPDIELVNLGTGPDGITPAGLLKDALHEINLATLKVVGEAAAKLGKDAGKTVGEEASKISKSIGDLFKK